MARYRVPLGARQALELESEDSASLREPGSRLSTVARGAVGSVPTGG